MFPIMYSNHLTLVWCFYTVSVNFVLFIPYQFRVSWPLTPCSHWASWLMGCSVVTTCGWWMRAFSNASVELHIYIWDIILNVLPGAFSQLRVSQNDLVCSDRLLLAAGTFCPQLFENIKSAQTGLHFFKRISIYFQWKCLKTCTVKPEKTMLNASGEYHSTALCL